jgi:hypothetical protein
MSQTPLVTGIVLGGVIISAIGAASSKFIEEKAPTVKSLSRDFIIGAVMVAMIMQLLPESSTSVVQFVLSLVPLSLFAEGKKVVETVTDVVAAVPAAAEEEEVRVGVPKF